MRSSDWSSDVCSSDLALDSLSPEGRAAIAEKLAGNLKTHVLYVSKRAATDSLPWPYGPEAIPCLRVLAGAKLAKAVQRDLVLKGDFDGLAPKFPLPRLAPAILPSTDGPTPLVAIPPTPHALTPPQACAPTNP